MVIPRNCMLQQGALWVGLRNLTQERMGEPDRRGGVGEGYYMHILYTENYNPGLRKALPERFSVRIGRIAPSERIEEVWGIVKGGAAGALDYGKRASSVLKL